MTENTDIIDNQETPERIPVRSLRPSELLEMKMLTMEAKSHLEYVTGGLKTFNLDERFNPERFDVTGRFCDIIINFCKEELKKSDTKKRKK
jgi:hypothetical protein